MESPNCVCGVPETVNHVLLECPRYYSCRVKWKHALHCMSVPFEIERILGKEALGDKQLKKRLYRHLAVYLQATGLVEKI